MMEMKIKRQRKTKHIMEVSLSEKVLQAIIYVVIATLCLVIILPCINVIALSFNDGKDAARGGIYFWPREFSLANYIEVFSDGKIMKAYVVTIARTVIGTFLSVMVTSFAAFALKEKNLPGRKTITMLITFTMLFGGGMIPTFIQFNRLGLIDSFWVYVVPSLVSVVYLLMMRTFFESVPSSLEESAKLDGCGYFRIYAKIMLPLSKPVIAVISLYTAVNHWNDWFSGAFYMKTSDLWPVQTVLQQMLSRAMATKQVTTASQAIAQNMSNVTSDSLKMAAVVVTTVPILCIYPFAQKHFAKGAMIGAVKE